MWLNPQFSADLVIFTGEFLNGKLHFLCRVSSGNRSEFKALFRVFSVNAGSCRCSTSRLNFSYFTLINIYNILLGKNCSYVELQYQLKISFKKFGTQHLRITWKLSFPFLKSKILIKATEIKLFPLALSKPVKSVQHPILTGLTLVKN